MTQEEIITEIMEEWGVMVFARLQQSMRDRGLVVSGETLSSLQFKVLAATASSNARLFLGFFDSGRIRDMKAVTWKKQPPVAVFEEFIRKTGLNKFKRVPGYSTKFPTEDIAVRRLAWAMVLSKKKINKTKPRKWFNKTFYGTLDVLINKLLDGHTGLVQQSIKEALTDGNS